MPRYISAHVIACMPRQRLERLIRTLVEEAAEVRLIRAWCDTVQGRMVCEWEAPDGEALRSWLQKHRTTAQWFFRVEYVAEEDRFFAYGEGTSG